jgi:hypothetical protein
VRQGCLLSPLLLLVVLDKVLKASLDGKARSIRWKLTKTLKDLDYADDICLLSHSQAHMQSKLSNLCYESRKAGFEMSFSKSEELSMNTQSQRNIMLANKAIRRVQLVRWDMSYDLGWCSTHFSGENLKATAHVSANELYMISHNLIVMYYNMKEHTRMWKPESKRPEELLLDTGKYGRHLT